MKLKTIIKILVFTLVIMLSAGVSKAVEDNQLVESSTYRILEKRGQISLIVPETRIEDFKKKFNQDETKIKVYNNISSEEEATEGYVKTGMVAKFENTNKNYILSVIGDINEDGEMTQIDLNLLIKLVIGFDTYEDLDIKNISADVNGDGQINQIDITTLIRYIMNHEIQVPEIVTIDGPQITIEGTSRDGWYNEDVNIEINSDIQPNIDSIVYRVTGAENIEEKEIKGKETIRLANNGEYDIIAYGYTKLGERTGVTIEKIRIDKNKPNLAINLTEFANSIKVDAEAEDELSGIKKYTYYIGTKNGQNITYGNGQEKTEATYTFEGLNPETEYYIKVEVEDNAGNKETKEQKIQTKPAKQTPTFTISKTAEDVVIDETTTFTIDYNGDGEITATSSDETIATVNLSNDKRTATITGKKAGTTTIIIKATEGATFSAGTNQTFTATVKKKTATLSLSENSGSIAVGKSRWVTIAYDGDGELKTSSDDSSIATAQIGDSGVGIMANAEGTTRIKVWATEGEKNLPVDATTYTVTVTKAKQTPTLTLSESYVNVYDTQSITINITYDGNGTLSAVSQKTSVASAVVNGTNLKITGRAFGSSIITVTASETDEYESATAQCNVDVQEATFSVSGWLDDDRVTYYKDLASAVSDCPSGGTVKMLKTCELGNGVEFNKNITFDTNRKTLSGSKNLLYSSGSITVNIKGGGTITSSVSDYGTIHPASSSTWVIENMGVINTGRWSFY